MSRFFLCMALVFVDSAVINNFKTPIEWSQIALSGQHTSMTTILDSNGDVYLCGGKVSLYSKSSKCIRIEVTNLITSNELDITLRSVASSNLKNSGPFPGIYFNAKAFTAETQNEGGIYGDRMCMLSISDGTNKPKCWCCDLSESKNAQCDDLQYTIKGGCPNRFEACVVHDETKNVIYQIGGYYGQTIFDSVLCFDLETETYLSGDECSFGKLVEPMYGAGCAVMDDAGSTIVVVGGLNTLQTSTSTTFGSSIDVCKSDGTDCQRLTSLTLDEGILKTRVFSIDACHIGIVGGTMKIDGSEVIGDNIDIANICSSQIGWVDKLTLPQPLSEMGIIKANNALCLYGGVSYSNGDSYSPQLSQSAYCTSLGYARPPSLTLSPTTMT